MPLNKLTRAPVLPVARSVGSPNGNYSNSEGEDTESQLAISAHTDDAVSLAFRIPPASPPSQGTPLTALQEYSEWQNPQGVQCRVITGPAETITDPSLLDDGFRASRYLPATSGDYEPLHAGMLPRVRLAHRIL